MKIAIVTGASGNMGQSVVKKFINEGYYVVGTIMNNERVTIDFPADKFEKVVVDLTNEDDSRKFIDSTVLKYCTIDVAVLTVGGFTIGDITHTTTADVYMQYKLNFETTYNVSRPVFVKMLDQNHGRIFIIGSRPGLDAEKGKGMVAYGLAKSLIFRLAELMNDEARCKNVVTSVVVPSTIDTPVNRKSMPHANFDHWVTPEQIADIIYWHCTEQGAVLREPLIKVYHNA